MTTAQNKHYQLPAVGGNPGLEPNVTTPGSFANKPSILPDVRGAKTFSSPDTPGMPPLSNKTAWDFLPEGWATFETENANAPQPELEDGKVYQSFTQADGSTRGVVFVCESGVDALRRQWIVGK